MRLSVLLMVGWLTGCGGGSGGSDGNGVTQPVADKSGCDLLTAAEVGEATGTTIASHEESGLNGCRWQAQGGARLMLDVYAGSSLSSGTCEAQRYLGTGREEAVAGLGDSALWKTSGSLVICSSRAVIRFNLDDAPRTVPENKEGLIKLARTVLGRL